MKKKKGARLGQHFLTGLWAASKLVEAAGIIAGDTVLEIGPGKGALTKEILKTGAHVVAVEKDPELVAYIRKNLPEDRVTVIESDVRDFKPEMCALHAGSYVLAANIPYYITGEIIRQFLECDAQPRTAALLIQKEVADRIIARSGKESILSLSVKAYGKPSIASRVPRGNFNPPPSVDSAILVIERISKSFFADIKESFFFSVVRAGFSSKRKFLVSNLASKFPLEAVHRAFQIANIPDKARAEDVGLSEWKTLVHALTTESGTFA